MGALKLRCTQLLLVMLGLSSVSWAGQGVARGAIALGPRDPGDVLPDSRVEQRPADADIFLSRPTQEAGEKLYQLRRSLEEKEHFQTETQQDVLAYQAANRDLMKWYLRTLLRQHLGNLIQGVRQGWRRERIYREARDRSPAARGDAAARPDSSGFTIRESLWKGASKTPQPAQVHESDRGGSGWAGRLISSAGTLLEHLTNGDGVGVVSSETLSARVRVETQSAMVGTSFSSPVGLLQVAYRLLPEGQSVPFTGGEGGQGERLTIGGSREVPLLAIHSSVSYQYEAEKLNCVLSRTIVGPLHGTVERSWSMKGSPPAARASLSLSLQL